MSHAGAFYLRLVGRPIEVYQYLEPLYNDYRKLRLRGAEGNFEQSHVDEVIDQLIVGDYMFDISLPHIPSRCLPGAQLVNGKHSNAPAEPRG